MFLAERSIARRSGLGERIERASQLGAWNLESVEIDAVELAGHLEERVVAARADRGDDAGRIGEDVLTRGALASHQRLTVGGRQGRRVAGETERDALERGSRDVRDRHGISRSIRVTRIPDAPSARRRPIVR